jgi:hypothetical protein
MGQRKIAEIHAESLRRFKRETKTGGKMIALLSERVLKRIRFSGRLSSHGEILTAKGKP